MSAVNPLNYDLDPLNGDSMDPNDPNSIMYDPSLAEKSGVAVVAGPGGQVVVVPTDNTIGIDDQNSDTNTGLNSVDTNDTNVQDSTQVRNDFARKLRNFDKIHGH